MNRSSERLVERIFKVTSVACIAGAAALVAISVKDRGTSEVLSPEAGQTTSSGKSEPVKVDPKVSRLSGVKMSKTIIPKSTTAVQPPAPELHTLIRVKCIMDFGDPKKNEAVIESLRTRQSKAYKAGDTIADVNATITEIGETVTFSYDGKVLKMDMRINERAESLPIATPNGPAPLAAGQK